MPTLIVRCVPVASGSQSMTPPMIELPISGPVLPASAQAAEQQTQKRTAEMAYKEHCQSRK